MKKSRKVANTSSSGTVKRSTSSEKKEKKMEYQFPELEEIKNGFDDFDVKNKGKISPKELCNTMKEMKLDEKYPYLFSIFSELKTDISYEELLEYLNEKMEEANQQKNLRTLFDFLLEESGGEKLPWQTFVRMARELNEEKSETELKQLLSLSGCAGDELSFEEFCEVMKEGGLDN